MCKAWRWRINKHSKDEEHSNRLRGLTKMTPDTWLLQSDRETIRYICGEELTIALRMNQGRRRKLRQALISANSKTIQDNADAGKMAALLGGSSKEKKTWAST